MRQEFSEWMRSTVKSIHYSDHNAMTLAFDKLERSKRLKQFNYKFKN